jgi:polyhydroxyalkanoate synthesis regulator phasin
MLEPLKGMQMMHYLLASDQRMSYVQQAVGNGVPQRVAYKRPDGRTEYIVESVSGANLANVVRTLAKAPDMNGEAANQLFTLYLLGKRADRVGYDKLNFSVDANSIKQAVRNIEGNDKLRDVFEEARTEYNKYNKDLMNFLKDTGVLPPSVADELAATNDYIPYYREQNGNAELVIGKEGVYRIGNLADQPQLRELIGGEDKILDFATSSVQNTSMIMDVGLRNLAAKNAMYELVGLDLAQFLGKDTASPDIVRFKDKGEEKFVRVATDTVGIPADLLVKGMEGIPVNTSALVKAMGFASGIVRKGVMLNPLYPVRQLLRDSVAAPLLSGADFAGPLGALRALGAGETKKKLEARAITGGQVYTGTNEDLARILKDLMGGRVGLSQFVAKAEAISMTADAATRRAQYDSYIRQGLSQMEATVMALESMNFNKRGLSPSMHIAATMIPFFNSQVQGLDVLWRAASGQLPMSARLDIQGKLVRRGALLMATAAAYALMMQDDEAYKNARPDEKYGNFFIRIPGLDEPIKFPVPFEVGYIFKGIPEAIVNSMADKNGGEEAWKAFKTIAIQTIPGGSSMLMPALVKPLLENATNYSFFGQRELETKREQQLLPEQRFRDKTSEVAKELGAMLGYSPIKIDNVISGYTGTMGLAAVQALSFAMPENLGPQEATKRLSDTPVIGSMFQPNDAGGIINATYDRVEHIMEVKRTYDDMIKRGEMAEAKAFLQENVNEIASASVAGNAKTQLFKITQAMNAVKASNMTPDEKRAALDNLQKLRIKIAGTMRNVLDKTAPQ